MYYLFLLDKSGQASHSKNQGHLSQDSGRLLHIPPKLIGIIPQFSDDSCQLLGILAGEQAAIYSICYQFRDAANICANGRRSPLLALHHRERTVLIHLRRANRELRLPNQCV